MTVSSAARRWGRRLGRVLLAGMGLCLFLYAVAFALTFTDRYENVPDEVWQTGDFRAIRTAAQAASPAAIDSAYASLMAEDAQRALNPASPPQLVNAADLWVAAINQYNPEAILYHDTDSFGNLYVVLGGWWGLLDAEGQVKALDGLGVAWRYHLRTSFGEWDASEGFEPGIVVVDNDGEVARNLNGEVKIFRSSHINP